MVFPRENHYFSWFGLLKYDPKSMPKRARKKHRQKASQKSILATILAPKILPKTSEILPKSDVKRSLFRDAMQLANKPCKVSGPRSFATVSLVFQRIRSALSVSLSLCLSVDLPLVALILKVSSATCNAYNHRLFPQIHPKFFPKSFQNPPKIVPKPFRNPPRTLPKPSFQNERVKNSFFLDFFQFFSIFWRARGLPNPPKIAQNRKKNAKKSK